MAFFSLKNYYPIEFLTANISSNINDTNNVVKLIADGRRMGITVNPPDINKSYADFTILDDKTMQYGLAAIKNVGYKASSQIAAHRDANGKYKNIFELSEPIAAASIAQVHTAKIKINEEDKLVAIKILRPDIEKLFNEELDALMLLAYFVENLVPKTKRLKLIESVHLLKEITNIEMDLRFEAAAANELYENTKNDDGFDVPKIYWNYTSKRILTLDKYSIKNHNP